MMLRRSLPLLLLVAACGEPSLVIENPLAIVHIGPSDGSVGIGRSVRPNVCFSEAVSAASAGAGLFLGDAQGRRLDGQSLENSSRECVAIVPAQPLEPETAYTIVVNKGVRAESGRTFAADVTSRFTTGR